MKTLLLIISILSISFAGHGQEDPGFKIYLEANNNVLKSNWNEAIKQFDELIKKHPKSNYVDDAYFWKAYSLKELKKYSDSFYVFEQLLDKYPESSYKTNAMDNIASITSKLPSNQMARAKRLTNKRTRMNLYTNSTVSAPMTFSYNPDAHDAIGYTSNEGVLVEELEDLERAAMVDVSSIFDDYSYVTIGSNFNLTEEDQIEAEAIKSYYQSKGKDSKDGLRKIMKSSKKSDGVKNIALRYYLKVENDFDEVLNVYKSQKNESFKKTILSGMYRYKTGNESQIILFTSSVLKDKNASYELKKAAFKSLSKMDNSYDELEDAYEVNNHISLKKSIISTMTRKYPDESKDFIFNVIKNKSEKESIRKNAVYYLSRNLKDFDKLETLYEDLDNENLKKEVIYSFFKLNTDESVEYLISLMKNTKTPVKVRKSIIHWLGKSKNPKASEAISDLLFD